MNKSESRKNLSLFAENRRNKSGFDIYLGYPGGKKEYIRSNRHNGLLFGIMKDGVKVEDLNRWLIGSGRLNGVGDRKSRSRSAAHVEGSIRQLLRIVNEMETDKTYDTISLSSVAAKAYARECAEREM